MKPSLFVIVPGFGKPFTEHKVQILQSNIAHLRKFEWANLAIRVCVYDWHVFKHLPEDMQNDRQITWIVAPGIVGEYIHKYARPEDVNGFDFVMPILDDVELHDDVDFSKILTYNSLFNFDVYSPALSLHSQRQFDYLVTKPNMPPSLFVLSACEAFCYFMPAAAYVKYYTHIEPCHNPWLWGMDMCLLKCLGLKAVMINHMRMTHHYKNTGYLLRPDKDPTDGYKLVAQKYNITFEQLATQQAILYYIIDGSPQATT